MWLSCLILWDYQCISYLYHSHQQGIVRWQTIRTPSILVKEVVLDNDTVSKAWLWLHFSIKIFIQKWYMYIFMKVYFKTNLFILFLHFQTQRLKSYSWFIFPMFDQNLVQNDFFYQYGGSMYTNKLTKINRCSYS
jgi:hypothetical protein